MSKKKEKDKKHYKLISASDVKNAYNFKRIQKVSNKVFEPEYWIPYYKVSIKADKITFKDLMNEDGTIEFKKIKYIKFKLPKNVLNSLDMLSSITKKKLENVKIKECKSNTEFLNVTMDIPTLIRLWNRYDMFNSAEVPSANPCCIIGYLIGNLGVVLDKNGEPIAKIAFLT